LNNQTRWVYDCVKSLLQKAIKEISLELREVSILMSKSQQWVCFNDTHHQCNNSSTLIVLLISESIRLLIHVQLVSLLQWHDNVFNNKQIFELVSILKSQWVCFNDTLNAMIYSFSSLYLSVNLVKCSHATSESASMTSSESISSISKSISESASMTWSMQRSTHFHRSTHQWTWSYIHVQLVSLLQWHHSILHSESATIDISILHKTKKIHSCKHESLKRESTVTILATHLCW